MNFKTRYFVSYIHHARGIKDLATSVIISKFLSKIELNTRTREKLVSSSNLERIIVTDWWERMGKKQGKKEARRSSFDELKRPSRWPNKSEKEANN